MDEALKHWLKTELNARADRLASGSNLTGDELAGWYRYETGVILGLHMVQDWLKEFNKKSSEDEI